MRKLSFWVKGLFVVTLIVPQISLAQTQSAGEQQIPQLLFVQMLNQGTHHAESISGRIAKDSQPTSRVRRFG